MVVDDQSSDQTPAIARKFAAQCSSVELVQTISSAAHLPGSKVVEAFNSGLKELDTNFDLICKFDADLIFPENYLEKITQLFTEDQKTGLAGGFCHIESKGHWVLENLTDRDHLRGALKAYRKECFEDIGGLKASMGWDTVDELLAQYHGWTVKTDPSLVVRHLRPTGFTYNKAAKLKQGQAFYKLRYGFLISLIASIKLAAMKKKPGLVKDYLQGYLEARRNRVPYLVSEKEGAFIRRLRYKKMLAKIF